MSKFDKGFLALLALVSVALIWTAGQDLLGPNRSVAVQAFAAVFTMLITVGLFFVSARAEQRAAQAERRTARSEQENVRLRETAEQQAASMQRLAEASARQAELLAVQQGEDAEIRLHLIDVGQLFTLAGSVGLKRFPSFRVVNMSSYGVFVQGITVLTLPGTVCIPVEMAEQGGPDPHSERSVLLAPGGARYLGLPRVSQLADLSGHRDVRNVLRVNIHCLYPGRGLSEVRFRITFQDWADDSGVEIERIDLHGNTLPG